MISESISLIRILLFSRSMMCISIARRSPSSPLTSCWHLPWILWKKAHHTSLYICIPIYIHICSYIYGSFSFAWSKGSQSWVSIIYLYILYMYMDVWVYIPIFWYLSLCYEQSSVCLMCSISDMRPTSSPSRPLANCCFTYVNEYVVVYLYYICE